MNERENNFDFLRLIFASFVLITHSYILSGEVECDIACQITNNQLKLSYLGVDGFFILSGYLIFQSLQKSPNIKAYFWKRVLRIFPALFFVLVLTLLFVPFLYISDLPLISNYSYFTYLPNNLSLFRLQYAINGVFENNPYPSVINGSLWTLAYEFLFYTLLSIFFIIKNNKLFVNFLLLFLFIISYLSNIYISNELKENSIFLSSIKIGAFLSFFTFFIGGALLSAINIEKYFQKHFILMFLLLLLITLYFEIYLVTKHLTLPLLILSFGLLPIHNLNQLLKSIGDLSYGIYIYSFPIQQTLVYFFKLSYLQLMLFSFILSFGFAYLSWNIIEKNAIKLKFLIK